MLVSRIKPCKSESKWFTGEITREIGAGAPFSFGRILGSGTSMMMGAVAMYNRALSAAELVGVKAY